MITGLKDVVPLVLCQYITGFWGGNRRTAKLLFQMVLTSRSNLSLCQKQEGINLGNFPIAKVTTIVYSDNEVSNDI